jgi:hypothetical protein
MAIFKAANGSRRANDPSPADDPAAVAFVTFFAILKVYEILLPGGHLLHRQSAEELRIECGGGRGRLLV